MSWLDDAYEPQRKGGAWVALLLCLVAGTLPLLWVLFVGEAPGSPEEDDEFADFQVPEDWRLTILEVDAEARRVRIRLEGLAATWTLRVPPSADLSVLEVGTRDLSRQTFGPHNVGYRTQETGTGSVEGRYLGKLANRDHEGQTDAALRLRIRLRGWVEPEPRDFIVHREFLDIHLAEGTYSFVHWVDTER